MQWMRAAAGIRAEVYQPRRNACASPEVLWSRRVSLRVDAAARRRQPSERPIVSGLPMPARKLMTSPLGRKGVSPRTRTAYHEAGHAVLRAAINDKPTHVSIRAAHGTLARS